MLSLGQARLSDSTDCRDAMGADKSQPLLKPQTRLFNFAFNSATWVLLSAAGASISASTNSCISDTAGFVMLTR